MFGEESFHVEMEVISLTEIMQHRLLSFGEEEGR